MKHHIITLLLTTTLLLWLCSCETTLPYQQQDEEQLTVNCVAATGQEIEVWVMRGLPLTEGKNMYNLSLEDFWQQTSHYLPEKLVVSDAIVTLTVNGSSTYTLAYDSTSTSYKCGYTPQEGDRIEMSVAAQGFETVTSQGTVLQSLELTEMRHETFFSQIATAEEHEYVRTQTSGLGSYDPYGADSVTTISFTFQDPAGESNYYRLKVRSVGEYHYFGRLFYQVSDVFTSSDPVFYDPSLTTGYAEWDPYFSNVFDDHLFDGQTYSITLNSRKRDEENNYFIVELQSISADLYYYLKSIQTYRISTDDAFSTPISIYSNFTNGWGILGTLSCKTYVVHE